ncbi:hypothetical protein ANTPLA_LOCUS4839 [Anthophora plagiata]
MGLKNISARWVPRLLSEENKRNRVIDSEAGLALFRCNPDEFLRRYITVDEISIHYDTPETKEQLKQWVFKSDPAPKKAKTVKSADKDLPKSYFLDGLKKLEKRWEKCINLKGNYVEK